MRVLHVSSGNLFGGIEIMLLTVARHRASCSEMEPHVALAFEGRLSRELTETGVPVHLLGSVRASRPHTVLRARRRLRDLLRRVGFDVVVCHAPWSHAVFGSAVRKAGIPLVFWTHGAADGRHWTQRWAALTPPDLTICNSHFTAETLPLLYPKCRHLVIHCPVAASAAPLSHEEREQIRVNTRTPAGAVVVLQVSRLEAWKGHSVLLEALRQLRDSQGWICWIAGYPQTDVERRYRDELRASVQSWHLADRVRFLETAQSVAGLYSAADVYCQPNTVPEPFGIAFVEAMLSGLPVVTTAMGGPREFVDKSCGVLLPPGDATALAEALRRLIGDATLRRTLGESGARRARELFDPALQLSRLSSALSAITSASLEQAC